MDISNYENIQALFNICAKYVKRAEKSRRRAGDKFSLGRKQSGAKQRELNFPHMESTALNSHFNVPTEHGWDHNLLGAHCGPLTLHAASPGCSDVYIYYLDTPGATPESNAS